MVRHLSRILALASPMLCLSLANPAAAADRPRIALLMPTQVVAYWTAYLKTFKETAEKGGVDVDVVENNFNASDQASQVDQTIGKHPAAIVLIPVDTSALVPSIRKISQSKIPLVVSNGLPDKSVAKYYNVFTGPDDIGNGAAAAKAMIQGFKEKGYGDKGKVVIVNGRLGQPPQVQRYQGFVDTLKKEAPGIEVVGAIPGDWDEVKGEAAASALLTQHKDAQGVFAEYDTMLQGSITAAERLGLDPTKLVLVGNGCEPSGIAAVESGKGYATVNQSAYQDGVLAAQAAVDLVNGKTPEPVQFLPITIVTKPNITDCYAYEKKS
jgi:ribose transport system substrate-binding protein